MLDLRIILIALASLTSGDVALASGQPCSSDLKAKSICSIHLNSTSDSAPVLRPTVFAFSALEGMAPESAPKGPIRAVVAPNGDFFAIDSSSYLRAQIDAGVNEISVKIVENQNTGTGVMASFWQKFHAKIGLYLVDEMGRKVPSQIKVLNNSYPDFKKLHEDPYLDVAYLARCKVENCKADFSEGYVKTSTKREEFKWADHFRTCAAMDQCSPVLKLTHATFPRPEETQKLEAIRNAAIAEIQRCHGTLERCGGFIE